MARIGLANERVDDDDGAFDFGVGQAGNVGSAHAAPPFAASASAAFSAM